MRTRMSGGVGGGLMPPYPDLPDFYPNPIVQLSDRPFRSRKRFSLLLIVFIT
jgi:hypothetical protein